MKGKSQQTKAYFCPGEVCHFLGGQFSTSGESWVNPVEAAGGSGAGRGTSGALASQTLISAKDKWSCGGSGARLSLS